MRLPYRTSWIVTLGAVAVLAGHGPASAASITSDAFVAVARPTVGLLAQSSALAETSTTSRRLRALARREAEDESAVAQAIDAWQAAEDRRTTKTPFESSLDRLSSAGAILTIPFAAVADATAPASPPLTPLPSADALEAAGQTDLRGLSTPQGASFDAGFVAIQRDALARLIRAYKSFILDGDDPVLRRIAVRDLPKVERYLADLGTPAS